MGGGLMQLVAYGAQDIYLTGNPQITFFKVVYRRHTNFSMEAIEQTWNGSSTADGRCTATISRNGDLVHRMYIETNTDTGVVGDNPGVSWIKSVELEIGGQKIDKHSGYWMETWAELTEPNPTSLVATCTTTQDGAGAGTLFQRMAGFGGVATAAGAIDLQFYIPLYFWFCRNPGLALPLIALQYHEVKVILDHSFTSGYGAAGTNKLWCDYIYLDTDERRRFAQVSHEYLIEQVQEQSIASGATSTDLNFNHPVKELIWTNGLNGTALGAANSAALVTPSAAYTDKFTLKLNGHDRFAAREHSYFSRVQVWEHHSGAGGLLSTTAAAAGTGGNDAICVYSFALKPEEHQPSGTCNFSRIDNAQLNTSGAFASSDAVKIFAVNYNVLRIMSGMGGLAYSN
jgi:hypothetical protein